MRCVLFATMGIDQSKASKIFKWIFLVTICLIAACITLFPILSQSRTISYWWVLWILGMFVMVFVLYSGFKFNAQILLWTCISLLCFRIIFNGIVLPIREKHLQKTHVKKIVKESQHYIQIKHG